MTEHEKAIQESEREDQLDAYFDCRAWVNRTSENESIFGAAFDRGWAAHARQPRNFCSDCGQRTPAGSVHTCSPEGAVAQVEAMAAQIEELSAYGDSWAEKAQNWRRLYGELRYPGMTGVIRASNAPTTGKGALRDGDQLPYPEGEVVGACVCGSWPGGECLKCPWIPAGSVHTCSPQSAVESMRPLLETWEGRTKEPQADAIGEALP